MADARAEVKLSERPGKNEAVVGSAAEYAAYVNFGTRRQDSNPFLSAAGEIVKAKLKGTITKDQQIELKKAIAKSFDKQRVEGVEIIRYGNPQKGIVEATVKSLESAAASVSTQAKRLCPVDEGYLRNSIMWRTEEKEGGLNVR